MKRWHEEYSVFYRQWKAHRKSHVETNKDSSRGRIGLDPQIIDCTCDEQVGRFRKKDAWDCGNTQCGICHNDKFPKRSLTNREVKSNFSYKEQLKDV
jgi:hypothetical protein